MITNLNDYWQTVQEKGTDAVKILLETEALFALTEAKAVVGLLGCPPPTDDDVTLIQERLVCLLIAHRAQVIAGYLMERAMGIPLASAEDPGIVVPGEVKPNRPKY